MRRLRIVNEDGFPRHTRVYDDEGNDVTESLHVLSIELEIDCGEVLNRGRIVTLMPALDITGDFDITERCACCGHERDAEESRA